MRMSMDNGTMNCMNVYKHVTMNVLCTMNELNEN